MKKGALLLYFWLGISIHVYGQNPDPANENSSAQPSSEITQVGERSKERIRRLIGTGVVNDDLATEAIEVINNLLVSVRADQDSIYTFARTINRNIDDIADENGNPCCTDFKENIRSITQELLRDSYTNDLFQNANLSNQIKIRLPLLIEDSLKLKKSNETTRDDFEEELELLAGRYLNSKRFRAGIGLSYSYLPSVRFDGFERIDLSPFAQNRLGGADRLQYTSDFSSKSFPSFMLSAKVPYVQIDASFPVFNYTNTIVSGVQFHGADSSGEEILSRSTVKSELNVDYDFSVKLSFTDIVDLFQQGRSSNYQFDAGLGIGLTGFSLENSITTDVRFRTDMTTTFNEIQSNEMVASNNDLSFNTPYVVGYYNFEISDEFHVGMNLRYYTESKTSGIEIDVDDITVSLTVQWFPTFPWR